MPLANFFAWQKDDLSVVTSLDIQLQAKIVEMIRDQFPDHNFLYEEGELQLLDNRSDYTWVIDPIDGTQNFIEGKKEFGSSVGLLHRDQFIAALVSFPKLGESYMALSGEGIFKNGNPFFMPGISQDNREIILCSRSYDDLKDSFAANGYDPRFYYCATYSLLRVLKGESLMYFTRNTNIYDVGPMSFILNMAGIFSYNRSSRIITFEPNLRKIPYFLAVIDKKIREEFQQIIGFFSH